ncbi:hypothetical protein EXT42_17705 [Pseudoalteromonas sp. CO302Y]|uniref:hypothetical protein n=1 Tax=unclassified Pseudoalteromonas TaxID=194690 RepID=UPI0010235A31|nr:hypothetical protein EXT42_17705 [Pseudoalteromonas sp. CO302Y]RZG06088.1 hypothetical protein EXT40_17710 [Pseudoalteromonas sp. CO133X]
MHQINKIQLIIVLSMLTLGCQEGENVNKKEDIPKNTVLQKEQNTPQTTTKKTEELTKTNSRSVNNNGEKLTYNSEQLVKGTIVFNHANSEQGTVTGTVFITLKTEEASLALLDTYKLKKVAEHTYSFFVDKGTDLKVVKTELEKYPEVGIVEIAVDYTPINEIR